MLQNTVKVYEQPWMEWTEIKQMSEWKSERVKDIRENEVDLEDGRNRNLLGKKCRAVTWNKDYDGSV